MDYRDVPKMGWKFDRVVSVGMVEHVGRGNYQLFTDCVNKVLKDGGIYLLHFISALKEHPGDAWMNKYIFPGSTVPSLWEMIYAMSEDNFHVLGKISACIITKHCFSGRKITKNLSMK